MSLPEKSQADAQLSFQLMARFRRWPNEASSTLPLDKLIAKRERRASVEMQAFISMMCDLMKNILIACTDERQTFKYDTRREKSMP